MVILAAIAGSALLSAFWCGVYVWLDTRTALELKARLPGEVCPTCGAESSHQRLDRRAS